MVDVVPGAASASSPPHIISTTCYWVLDRSAGVPPSRPPGLLGRLVPGFILRRRARARGAAWLPLWQWHRPGQRVSVWDYSSESAAAASSSQQSAFEGKADAIAAAAVAGAAAAAVDGVAAAPCTVRAFACGGDTKSEAFELAERQILQQAEDARNNKARAARRLRSTLMGGAAPPLVTLCYGASGAVVELAAHQAPAKAEGGAGSAAAAAARGAHLSATAAAAAAGVRLHLNFEPRQLLPAELGRGKRAHRGDASAAEAAAAAARPLAAVGSIFLELGAMGLAARGTDLDRRGTHTATLLFSAESALAKETNLPQWALHQLRLADRAVAGSSRTMPPVAALLRNAQGEQWLLCCDALATAAIGYNQTTLWPSQPQGLRCWYSRGAPLGQTAAAAVAAADQPKGAVRRAPARASSGLRSQVRWAGSGFEPSNFPLAGAFIMRSPPPPAPPPILIPNQNPIRLNLGPPPQRNDGGAGHAQRP
jgi:hypothetical protein